MSDTPKTDAFISKFYKSRPLSSGSRHRTDVELHDFARQLERELTALREQLKDCSSAFDRQQEMLDRNAEQIAALREQLVQALAIARKYEPDEKTSYVKYASDEIAELLKEKGK